jgi:hypothetical protein
MPLIIEDPAHWRGRALEARIIIDQMKDPEAKRTMRDIATSYELLAEWAERCNRGTPKV